jgi:hypothetical protein
MNNILGNVHGISNYTQLIGSFKQDNLSLRKNNYSENENYKYSADYYRDNFDNYSKFFEYIINNTDKETDFAISSKKESSLSNKLGKEEERNKMNFKDSTSEERDKYLLPIPKSYIDKNVDFDTAWQRAKKAQ